MKATIHKFFEHREVLESRIIVEASVYLVGVPVLRSLVFTASLVVMKYFALVIPLGKSCFTLTCRSEMNKTFKVLKPARQIVQQKDMIQNLGDELIHFHEGSEFFCNRTASTDAQTEAHHTSKESKSMLG